MFYIVNNGGDIVYPSDSSAVQERDDYTTTIPNLNPKGFYFHYRPSDEHIVCFTKATATERGISNQYYAVYYGDSNSSDVASDFLNRTESALSKIDLQSSSSDESAQAIYGNLLDVSSSELAIEDDVLTTLLNDPDYQDHPIQLGTPDFASAVGVWKNLMNRPEDLSVTVCGSGIVDGLPESDILIIPQDTEEVGAPTRDTKRDIDSRNFHEQVDSTREKLTNLIASRSDSTTISADRFVEIANSQFPSNRGNSIAELGVNLLSSTDRESRRQKYIAISAIISLLSVITIAWFLGVISEYQSALTTQVFIRFDRIPLLGSSLPAIPLSSYILFVPNLVVVAISGYILLKRSNLKSMITEALLSGQQDNGGAQAQPEGAVPPSTQPIEPESTAKEILQDIRTLNDHPGFSAHDSSGLVALLQNDLFTEIDSIEVFDDRGYKIDKLKQLVSSTVATAVGVGFVSALGIVFSSVVISFWTEFLSILLVLSVLGLLSVSLLKVLETVAERQSTQTTKQPGSTDNTSTGAIIPIAQGLIFFVGVILLTNIGSQLLVTEGSSLRIIFGGPLWSIGKLSGFPSVGIYLVTVLCAYAGTVVAGLLFATLGHPPNKPDFITNVSLLAGTLIGIITGFTEISLGVGLPLLSGSLDTTPYLWMVIGLLLGLGIGAILTATSAKFFDNRSVGVFPHLLLVLGGVWLLIEYLPIFSSIVSPVEGSVYSIVSIGMVALLGVSIRRKFDAQGKQSVFIFGPDEIDLAKYVALLSYNSIGDSNESAEFISNNDACANKTQELIKNREKVQQDKIQPIKFLCKDNSSNQFTIWSVDTSRNIFNQVVNNLENTDHYSSKEFLKKDRKNSIKNGEPGQRVFGQIAKDAENSDMIIVVFSPKININEYINLLNNIGNEKRVIGIIGDIEDECNKWVSENGIESLDSIDVDKNWNYFQSEIMDKVFEKEDWNQLIGMIDNNTLEDIPPVDRVKIQPKNLPSNQHEPINRVIGSSTLLDKIVDQK